MLLEPAQIQFYILLAKACLMFGCFLVASLGTYSALRFLVPDREYNWINIGLSLVLGPLIMSWILTMAMALLPGYPRHFFIVLPLIPFVLLLPFSARDLWTDLNSGIVKYIHDKDERPYGVFLHIVALAAGFVLIFALGGLVTTNALTPLNGNDAFEYFGVARLIAERGDVSLYPITDHTTANGFMATFTHPLGYINLLAYGYMIQGTMDTSLVSRFVAPYFAFALSVLLVAFAGFGRRTTGAFTALFMLSTPAFYTLVVQMHIDPSRMAGLTAAVAATWIACRKPSFKAGIFAGLACGCSMFTHSIGILTLPLVVPMYILLARKNALVNHMVVLTLMVSIAVGMLAYRYSINLNTFGSIISDSVEVWEAPQLHVDHMRIVTRFMESPLDKIYNGALMSFTRPDLFGYYAYLLLFALTAWGWVNRRTWAKRPLNFVTKQHWRDISDPTYAAVLIALGYFAMMVLSVLANTDLAIKNARYVLTVQPFVIMATARILLDYFMFDTDPSLESVGQEYQDALLDAEDSRAAS